MILSAHASNGGPRVARPEPLSTRRMLKLLRKRLEKVTTRELTKKQSSVKQIHQLRVATRKALAALSVCKPLLPKSTTKRIEKSLKAKRKALGTIRDWDVLMTRVLGTPADDKADLRCDLLLYLAEERKRAWRSARKAWGKSNSLDNRASRFSTKRSAGDKTAHQLFRDAFREPLTNIRAGVSPAVAEPMKMETLHELRIACKSLRYLLEYREEVTGAVSQSRDSSSALALLTEAQKRLGELHDLSVRPALLRSGRLAERKAVRNWLENAVNRAEGRLAEEIKRYLAWQNEVDFENAFRDLDRVNQLA